MDQHKKVLGIIYLVTATLQIIVLGFLSTIFSFIIAMVSKEASGDGAWVLEMVSSILRWLPWTIIIIISIPSLIAGFGLINKQPWALILALVLGCLKLFSFPIGTAIGVYSIWVYVESGKVEKSNAG